MNSHLHGKRALVTGSSSGIGAEIARMLASEGVKVIVHGRDETRAKAVTKEIESAGGQAVVALGDLNSEAAAAVVVETAQQAFDGIDILVNNVGGSASVAHQSWFDAPLEEWTENYQHNVLVAVQISSRNAISPHAQFGGYGAAKAALNNFTLSLSKALSGTGVTSNGIMPGLIDTPQLDSWFVQIAENHAGTRDPQVGRQYVLKNIVHQAVDRLGEPKDIAAAVCYLASPLSDFMTGTTFRIDGGSTPTV